MGAKCKRIITPPGARAGERIRQRVPKEDLVALRRDPQRVAVDREAGRIDDGVRHRTGNIAATARKPPEPPLRTGRLSPEQLRASWAFRRTHLPTRAPAWASPTFSKCNSTTAPLEPLRGGSPDPPRDQTALARFSRRVRRPAALSGAVVIGSLRYPRVADTRNHGRSRTRRPLGRPGDGVQSQSESYAQSPQTSQNARPFHSPVMYIKCTQLRFPIAAGAAWRGDGRDHNPCVVEPRRFRRIFRLTFFWRGVYLPQSRGVPRGADVYLPRVSEAWVALESRRNKGVGLPGLAPGNS